MTASPGCRLLEIDFSGLEAVLVGWFARDPAFIRLAKLGVHAYVASHLLHRPADLAWSNADLAAYFKEIKNSTDPVTTLAYNQGKRTVHGTGYGMTPQGMALMFPQYFPTQKAAKHVQDVYFAVAPSVPQWQHALRLRAYEQRYLGGPPRPGYTVLTDANAHPFGYRHYYYGVVSFKPIDERQRKRLEADRVPTIEMNGRWYVMVWGEESKSCIAFYPQSTGSGILKEVMIPLFAERDHPSYIGDAFYGRTPLRAPIHDSLFLEVPNRAFDRVLECAFREMIRPIEQMPLPPEWQMGSHLVIEADAKAGTDWKHMEKIPGVRFESLGPDDWEPRVAADRFVVPASEAEEEDLEDLLVQIPLPKESVYA